MADVQIQDGIINVVTRLEVQDPKAAAVLAEFPQIRWPEITRTSDQDRVRLSQRRGKD